MELALWLKIILFIIFIIYFSLIPRYLYRFYVKKLVQIKNYKIKMFFNLFSSIFLFDNILILGIFILTLYFAWQILLMMYIIDLIPSIIIMIYFIKIGEKNFEEMITEQIIQLFEKKSPGQSLIFRENFYLFIIGILNYIIIGIIYFGLNLPPDKHTIYIISGFFIVMSIYFIKILFSSFKQTISPRIESRVRKEYLLSNSVILFRLSFLFAFFLWAFDFGIFEPVFIFNKTNVSWFYILILFSMLLFIFIVSLYTIGEKRRKKKELKHLRDYKEFLYKIKKSINLEDFEDSKTALFSKVQEINASIKNLEFEIQELKNKCSHEEFNGFFNLLMLLYSSSDLMINNKDDLIEHVVYLMEKPIVDQIDNLKSLLEEINYCLNYGDKNSLFHFKGQISSKKNEIKQEIKSVDDRKTFIWKWNILAGAIWTFLQIMLNLSLVNVLNYVATSLAML